MSFGRGVAVVMCAELLWGAELLSRGPLCYVHGPEASTPGYELAVGVKKGDGISPPYGALLPSKGSGSSCRSHLIN